MAGRFFWIPQSLATWGDRRQFWDSDASSEEDKWGASQKEHLEFLVQKAKLVLQLSTSPQTQVWQEFSLGKGMMMVRAHATRSWVLSCPAPKAVGRFGGDVCEAHLLRLN